MNRIYGTDGSVRGDCGHRHRTLGGAVRCLRADQSGCARQGGYSDRGIVVRSGDDLTQDEIYTIDAIFDAIEDGVL